MTRAIALGGIVVEPDPPAKPKRVRITSNRWPSALSVISSVFPDPPAHPLQYHAGVTTASVGVSPSWRPTSCAHYSPTIPAAQWQPLVQSSLRQRVAVAREAALASGFMPTKVWLGRQELAELETILAHDIPYTSGHDPSNMNINLVGLRVVRDSTRDSRLEVA